MKKEFGSQMETKTLCHKARPSKWERYCHSTRASLILKFNLFESENI
jgi:hypothetical protein